jgi:long-chain acyl-CoA synthetase
VTYPGHYAEVDPERPAVIMGAAGTVVTYGELDERSNRLARLLHAAGLRPGDVLAVFMENNPRYAEVAWAALRSGLYLTPVNSHLTPDEVAYIIDDCGASAMISSAALATLCDQLPDPTIGRIPVRLVVGGGSERFDSYEQSIADHPGDRLGDERSGAYLFYSSGTTGRPKGVRQPMPEALPSLRQPRVEGLARLYGYREGMRYLSPAPMYHAAPLGASVSVQRYGGTVVMMERFDPADALSLIERHRITHSQWVPTMFIRMLRLSDEDRLGPDLSSHESATHAAAPCPVDVKRRMIEWWGPIVYEYYSGTELSGTTYITSEEWLEHPGSVGRPVQGSVHIVGEDGCELPAGEVGTIYFAGGSPFEYLNDPAKTADAYLPGGLSTMGDVGYVDDGGWLYLTDRRAHTIISGGVNVYPREAEDALLGHPAVADVAVLGVPDDDMGEQVKAVVQPVPSASTGPDLERELIAFCRERLAAFKCPRSVDFVDDLPRAPTGKLAKRVLRDRYWAHAAATTT